MKLSYKTRSSLRRHVVTLLTEFAGLCLLETGTANAESLFISIRVEIVSFEHTVGLVVQLLALNYLVFLGFIQLVGQEKRETEALKLFHEEQNKKQAQELLEQYLAYKKVSL